MIQINANSSAPKWSQYLSVWEVCDVVRVSKTHNYITRVLRTFQRCAFEAYVYL